jgi:hypothetical protein
MKSACKSSRIGKWCMRRPIVGCMWTLLLSHLNARKASSQYTLLYSPRTRRSYINNNNEGVDGRELAQDIASNFISCPNIHAVWTRAQSIHLVAERIIFRHTNNASRRWCSHTESARKGCTTRLQDFAPQTPLTASTLR